MKTKLYLPMLLLLLLWSINKLQAQDTSIIKSKYLVDSIYFSLYTIEENLDKDTLDTKLSIIDASGILGSLEQTLNDYSKKSKDIKDQKLPVFFIDFIKQVKSWIDNGANSNSLNAWSKEMNSFRAKYNKIENRFLQIQYQAQIDNINKDLNNLEKEVDSISTNTEIIKDSTTINYKLIKEVGDTSKTRDAKLNKRIDTILQKLEEKQTFTRIGSSVISESGNSSLWIHNLGIQIVKEKQNEDLWDTGFSAELILGTNPSSEINLGASLLHIWKKDDIWVELGPMIYKKPVVIKDNGKALHLKGGFQYRFIKDYDLWLGVQASTLTSIGLQLSYRL